MCNGLLYVCSACLCCGCNLFCFFFLLLITTTCCYASNPKYIILVVKLWILQLTPLRVGCTVGESTLEVYFQVQISQRIENNVMRSIYTMRDHVVKNSHIMDRCALYSVASITSLSTRDIDPEDERVRRVHKEAQIN